MSEVETSPLLRPIPVGSKRMPNRVLFGPIETNLAQGRALSHRHTAFYQARAAGGSGAIVIEQASVHPIDHPYERCPLAAEAGSGWTAIAEACRPFGALILAGLSHSGGQSTSAFSQRELWAPSDEPDVDTREVPKIMEPADIRAVIDGFETAAALALDCGLDGVEINAGQFSLIRQFLSGLTNRRDDDYGHDRARLAREVLTACRRAVGDGVLGLRLSCDELAPWAGITPEAAAELVADLAPLLDYLVVVRGGIFSMAETRPTAHHPPGFNLDLSGAIRAAVRDGGSTVPVFAQGSIVDVDQAGWAVASGRCDGVEMTRAQLADPDLVGKLAGGRRVRPCVLCNQGCQVRDNRNPIISCIVEPSCGREGLWQAPGDAPPEGGADRTARLLVVGSGPAGLEAARVAAGNGWSVEVRERAGRVGGMAAVAAVAPAQSRLAELVSWLEAEADEAGVTIRLGSPVSAADVEAFDGEVILATGSVEAPSTFRRADGARVLAAADALDALAAEEEPTDLGDADHVVVWDPIGATTGVAVAELVAARHPNVALLTPDAIAGTMLSLTGDLAGANVRLQQAGVTLLRRERLTEVEPGVIRTVHSFTGEQGAHPCDLLIDASARYPDEALWISSGQRHLRVGDAVAPRTVGEAIREGRTAALALGPAPSAAGARR